MASTLLLMRHGKAKAIELGQADFDRELTEAGKRSLAANLPSMLVQLEKGPCSVQVWASPSARTMQTAEYLVKALRERGVKPEGDILPVDELWKQDYTAFLDKVRECSADTVIAIGHNPMIEEMTAQIVDAQIPFSTGAIVAMQLNWEQAQHSAQAPETANESSHRLLWFSQGPISQHWRTLVKMEKMLGEASSDIEERLEAFFENPEDVETMHKFRVSIRTMRSLVDFVKPWQDAKQNAAMQADLKEVVGITSRLRELDVLAEQAKEADATSYALVAFLEGQAAEERERVSSALSKKRVKKLLQHVDDQASDIRWKRTYRTCGLSAREIRARFDEMAGDLEQDLSTLNLADVEPTHDVRKSAKRVRYAAENFKNLIGEDAIGVAKGMTAHQDNLGAVCDARVNIDIINALQEREDLPDQVAWDLTLLRAQNETFLYTTLREQANSQLGNTKPALERPR